MCLTIQQNVPLSSFNTFGIPVLARYFVEINREEQLAELFGMEEWKAVPKLILGGGSNILFTRDFTGLVIYIHIQGIQYQQQGETVRVEAGAGEVWKELVAYCVDRGFAGIENLSLIPGTVGAAPVQNIGAYGVELMDVFLFCRAFDTHTGVFVQFTKSECQFSYRDSIFKSAERGRYIIVKVVLSLSLQPHLKLDYGAIRAELSAQNITSPTIKNVASVVSKIRVEKLPDPATIGNAGSFFKNPIVSANTVNTLRKQFPDLVYYPMQGGDFKLAAGWLIERCGWKGKRQGNTGTWKNQALVLVNHGGASGAEIFLFSEEIIQSVRQSFGVVLEREVNVL